MCKSQYLACDVGEIAFPLLLQRSLNSSLILHQKLVRIEIIFHFDACGSETFVQFKALNPRGINFFHQYGCSTPVVLCGWAHKESNLMKLGPTVLADILSAIEEPYKIPQLPNTLILLDWKYMTGTFALKIDWSCFCVCQRIGRRWDILWDGKCNEVIIVMELQWMKDKVGEIFFTFQIQ